MNIKPEIIQVFNDDGSHKHWALINPFSGHKLWSEDLVEMNETQIIKDLKSEEKSLRDFNSALILKIDELVKTANGFISASEQNEY